MWTERVPLLGLLFLLAIGEVAQAEPISAGPSLQTFALATSDPAVCPNPPGPCGTLMSLDINLAQDSLLTITFTARGTVSQPTMAIVETNISCDVDGVPCQPDVNGVEFRYPPNCCDTRSFTFVIPVLAGSHTVNINWVTLNQGSSLISNRTLHVQAAAL